MSEIYRDPSEGAAAKRRDLLRRRRDELATMPHAIRRVVVARSARIAASTAVIVVGALLVIMAQHPLSLDWIVKLPNHDALLASLLAAMWIVGVCAWWVARARAEHRFAVAMSRYVLPGEDLDQDIERLDHEHPDDAARQMAHRLEVRSAALPVLASTLLLPATAIYLFQLAHAGDWPMLGVLEDRLAGHADAMLLIALVGVLAAIATTRPALRMPLAAPIATAVVIAAAPVAGFAAFELPGEIAWTALTLTALALPLAIVAYRLRVERVAIASDDPAAGSELWTVRGMLRALAGLRRFATKRNVAIAVACTAAATGSIMLLTHKHKAEGSPQLATVPTVATPETRSGYHLDQDIDGKLHVDVLVDNDTVVIPALTDLENVPHGWRAHLMILADEVAPGATVTPFGTHETTALTRATELVIENCDGGDHPLGIVIGGPNQHVVLHVEPTLSLGHCL